MKVVIDTNVVISAFVFKGNCEKVLETCYGRFNLTISTWVLQEIKNVLKRKFEIPDDKINDLEAILSESFTIVIPNNLMPNVCRDADDNNVLQLAEFIGADYLVTGDKDLLILKSYNNVKIFNPKEFLELFKE